MLLERTFAMAQAAAAESGVATHAAERHRADVETQTTAWWLTDAMQVCSDVWALLKKSQAWRTWQHSGLHQACLRGALERWTPFEIDRSTDRSINRGASAVLSPVAAVAASATGTGSQGGGADVGGCQYTFLVPTEAICPVNFSGMSVRSAVLQGRLREELQLSGRMPFTVGSGEPRHLTQMQARFQSRIHHSKLGCVCNASIANREGRLCGRQPPAAAPDVLRCRRHSGPPQQPFSDRDLTDSQAPEQLLAQLIVTMCRWRRCRTSNMASCCTIMLWLLPGTCCCVQHRYVNPRRATNGW